MFSTFKICGFGNRLSAKRCWISLWVKASIRLVKTQACSSKWLAGLSRLVNPRDSMAWRLRADPGPKSCKTWLCTPFYPHVMTQKTFETSLSIPRYLQEVATEGLNSMIWQRNIPIQSQWHTNKQTNWSTNKESKQTSKGKKGKKTWLDKGTARPVLLLGETRSPWAEGEMIRPGRSAAKGVINQK